MTQRKMGRRVKRNWRGDGRMYFLLYCVVYSINAFLLLLLQWSAALEVSCDLEP
jgi:hypothetical protein